MYCLGTPEREITDGDTLLLLGQQNIWAGRLHIPIYASEAEQRRLFLVSYNVRHGHYRWNRILKRVQTKRNAICTKSFIFSDGDKRKTRAQTVASWEHKCNNKMTHRGRSAILQNPLVWFSAHLSLFLLANTMPLTPQRIIGQALQKTNNLLALCLTEQHCQSARNHPF